MAKPKNKSKKKKNGAGKKKSNPGHTSKGNQVAGSRVSRRNPKPSRARI